MCAIFSIDKNYCLLRVIVKILVHTLSLTFCRLNFFAQIKSLDFVSKIKLQHSKAKFTYTLRNFKYKKLCFRLFDDALNFKPLFRCRLHSFVVHVLVHSVAKYGVSPCTLPEGRILFLCHCNIIIKWKSTSQRRKKK